MRWWKSGLVIGHLTATALFAAATPPAVQKDGPPMHEVSAAAPEDSYPIRFATQPPARPDSALADTALVLGVVVGDEARAYPLSTLWEEGKHTVNDDLGDSPIAVSMCPLAGVGATYLRKVGNDVLDIGSLVRIDRGSLVLYDRQTHTSWNLLSGDALSGQLEGQSLRGIPTTFTTWAYWRAMHPTTTVYVSPDADAGLALDASRMRRILLSTSGPPRDRDWVLGLRCSKDADAVLVRQIAGRRVANVTVDDRPLVVFLALDLTTTAAWERSASGRTLTFRAEGDTMTDAETGSSWNPFTGMAMTGPLKDQKLRRVSLLPAFWHAWKAHHPDATILDVPLD